MQIQFPQNTKNCGFTKLKSHKKLVSQGNACVACITSTCILKFCSIIIDQLTRVKHIDSFTEWLKKGNVQMILRKRVEAVISRDLSEVCR